MNKDQARKEIEKLVSKYELVKSSGKINKYSEEETKKDFILPLFRALGWDIEDKNEVSAEEYINSSGLVDYGFYLKERAKFYVEAKKLSVDLNDEDYARQTTKYAFNKGITWAILTDFEGLKVFNALAVSKYFGDKEFFELKYSEYLPRFDQLWLLSKEAFQEDLLDKEAEKYGKKLQRVPVSESLYEDLEEAREILVKAFHLWNEDVSEDVLDEGVQKVIDRLVFIRVAEDRKIEPPTLVPLVNQWESGGRKTTLYESMIYKFRELDEFYNSDLFSKHFSEDWKEHSDAVKKVIEILYGKKGYYEYDFKLIPADVLGSVYENYLSYKLSKSEKGLTLDKAAEKRKQQGIYYTPPFIVDYIVRQTLKPILDNCTSVNDLKKIKVIDPACGSGSFLIKAMEVILEKYEEYNYPDNENLRIQIILENIFGIDLDDQAVEIAKLNLLINAFKERGKLPSLEHNIINGNSLISGTTSKLEKDFGKNFREKKPLDWTVIFPDVYKEGGFDAIIGNPPYISYYSKQSQANEDTKGELKYFISEYDFIEDKKKLGRFNTLMFFIEKSIKNLKTNGYLGFLVDTNIHSNPSEPIRRYMASSTTLLNIVDNIRAFKDVGSSQLIFTLKKAKSENNIVTWSSIKDYSFEPIGSRLQKAINEENNYSFSAPNEEFTEKVLKKIKSNSSLESIVGKKYIRTCITFTGKKESFVVTKKEKEIDYPLLEGSYSLPYPYARLRSESFIRYDIALRDKLNDEYQKEAIKENKRSPKVIGLGDINLFKAPKIFIRLSDKRVTASYTNKFFCADLSLYILTLPNLKDENSDIILLYLLGVLNSKVVTYFMIQSNLIRNINTGTPQIRLEDIRSIPVPKVSISKQQKIAKLAKNILELNEKLYSTAQQSGEWVSLNRDINNLRGTVDKEVYPLYGLDSKEIEIIKSSTI